MVFIMFCLYHVFSRRDLNIKFGEELLHPQEFWKGYMTHSTLFELLDKVP